MDLCKVLNVASSKYWQIFKGIVGVIATVIAVISYINGKQLIQAIFLTFVAVVTLGDVIMNWLKYKLLDAEIAMLSTNNDRLKLTAEDLEKSNETYKGENEIYQKSNEDFTIHIGDLKDEITHNSDEHAKQILNLNDSNLHLSGEVNRLEITEEKLTKKVNEITVVKDELSISAEIFKTENETLKESVKKTDRILINSKKLINSLMAGGDDFKKFNKIFEENNNKLADTEHMLSVMVNGMQEDMFAEMDTDGDNNVTVEEMRIFILKQKSHRNKINIDEEKDDTLPKSFSFKITPPEPTDSSLSIPRKKKHRSKSPRKRRSSKKKSKSKMKK